MAFGGPPKPGGSGCFIAWFVFCALLSLGGLGLIVWSVISLVNHATG